MKSGVEIIDISSSEDEEPNNNQDNGVDLNPKDESEDSKADIISRRRKKIDEMLDKCIIFHNRCVAIESLMNPRQLQRWNNHLASINPINRPQSSNSQYNFNNSNVTYQGNSDYVAASPPVQAPPRPARRRPVNPRRRFKKKKTTTSPKVAAKSPVGQLAKCKAAAKKIAQARSPKTVRVKSEPRASTSRVKTEPRPAASRVKQEH